MSAKRHTKTVCRGLFLRVVCRRDMPFLEKIADITMLGRHVGDMSATFPAKSFSPYRTPVINWKRYILYLDCNSLTNEVLVSLTSALTNNSWLKELTIQDNDDSIDDSIDDNPVEIIFF